MPTQPPGVWTFEKLAPDSAWQYNATALEDVRKITARLKIKKRLQEKKLGGVIGTALPIGHYKTCAVVGNSGVLLGSRCGAEIDSMDYVIRIDLPVLRGIASDAAKKRIAAPTTGLVSVLMMTTFCDRSYMYGFFPFMEDANNQSIPYHYYPDDKLHIPFGVGFEAKHDVKTEYEFLRDLHRRGVLKMHLGPCGNQ
ncbi:CMP-N-acetylneuraminate-poly-alpha-2,8-sialyltransferase-like [Branchiostoma lanceolatum]|uniref:CMP-N-acetylneuraminate-poly-alpha-2, 8-sialyltransferase-like n=1 Tax=Branchiostoma lanceolatum TaxID=7740 RepID=UPI003452DD3C